jgi:hypothetical protein
MLEAGGQPLDGLKRFVNVGNFDLEFPRFAGRLQASTHAGKQHETQLTLGLTQKAFNLGHRQLQPFGGGAQVASLHKRVDHFDMA